MSRIKFCVLVIFTFAILSVLNGNTPPSVTNVSASQRTDGSKIVDIWYSVNDADNDTLTVSLAVTNDNGASFGITPSPANLSGEVGENIIQGTNKHIVWNAGNEGIAFSGNQFKVKVTATEKINLSYGLVAYYPFNGNANDESGNGHDGTPNGVTLTTDRFGSANKAYWFDGNSYIQANDDNFPYGSDMRTVFVWVYMTDYGNENYSHIIHYGSGFTGQAWGMAVANYIMGGYYQGGLSSHEWAVEQYIGTVPLNTWTQLAIVLSNSGVKDYYMNGAYLGSFTYEPNTVSSGYMRIGSRITGQPVEFFHGKIDDIRLYNRALSQEEIQALYHEGGWTGNP